MGVSSELTGGVSVCLVSYSRGRFVQSWSSPSWANYYSRYCVRDDPHHTQSRVVCPHPVACVGRWCSLVALHLTILTPGYTFAQDARVSVGFLPIKGQPIKGSRETPLFTFELVEPVSRGAVSLPALSLTSTESGADGVELHVRFSGPETRPDVLQPPLWGPEIWRRFLGRVAVGYVAQAASSAGV